MRSFNILALALVSAACSHNTPPQNTAAQTSTAQTVTDSSAAFIYKCPADCGSCKEETELQLFTHANTYKLQSGAHVLTGSYNTERGFETDENATLYILNDGMPTEQQLYFVRETGKDSLLVQLDGQRHRGDLILKRTK